MNKYEFNKKRITIFLSVIFIFVLVLVGAFKHSYNKDSEMEQNLTTTQAETAETTTTEEATSKNLTQSTETTTQQNKEEQEKTNSKKGTDNSDTTKSKLGNTNSVAEANKQSDNGTITKKEVDKKEECKPTESEKLVVNSYVAADVPERITKEFYRLVNEERARVGVPRLKANYYLDCAAKNRSNELITKYSHTRPDGSNYSTAIDENKYNELCSGENICFSSHLGSGRFAIEECEFNSTDEQICQTAFTIFCLFKNSAPHYRNMISPSYEDTGIGVSYKIAENGIPYFYVCHLFGKEMECDTM